MNAKRINYEFVINYIISNKLETLLILDTLFIALLLLSIVIKFASIFAFIVLAIAPFLAFFYKTRRISKAVECCINHYNYISIILFIVSVVVAVSTLLTKYKFSSVLLVVTVALLIFEIIGLVLDFKECSKLEYVDTLSFIFLRLIFVVITLFLLMIFYPLIPLALIFSYLSWKLYL